MKQRFYSKKDKGMIIFMVVFVLFLLFVFSTLFFGITKKPAPVFVKILIGTLTLGMSAFLSSMLLNTWYEIDNEFLICRSGPIVKKISISSIRTVSKPKKIFLNQSYLSLGLSFTQVLISYNSYDDVSISPADYDEFMNALIQRNPKIVVG